MRRWTGTRTAPAPNASRCAGSANPASAATSPIASSPPRRTASPMRSARSASEQGGRVFLLLGRVPELYVAMLGALKAKCVVTPLFSAFGPEPIATRLEIGDGQVLVTTEALYRRKVEALRDQLPKLAHVILIDDGPPVAGTLRWREVMAAADGRFTIPPTDPEDMALRAFHQRHDRAGRRARSTSTRRWSRITVTGAIRARSARRRRLLVHRRSGLGDRHQLRHHRAADARRDQSGRRSGVRRAELVRHPAGRAGQRLVHRADRDPHDDEARRRCGARLRPAARCASWRASASRSIRKRCCGASRRSASRSTTIGGRPRPAAS